MVVTQPHGLAQVMERIEEIKARFPARGGEFAAALASAMCVREPRVGGTGDTTAGGAGLEPGLRGAGLEPALLGGAIASAAARHGLDPALLTALVDAESGFRADAISPDGAIGLTQLMPATARRLGVLDAFDLQANLDGGARYLQEQLARFSQLPLALAAYNAGPEAVTRHGGIPPYPETRRFVSRVLDLVRRYAGQGR